MGLVFCFFLFPLNTSHLNICSPCFRGGGDGVGLLFLSFSLEHELLEHLFSLFQGRGRWGWFAVSFFFLRT